MTATLNWTVVTRQVTGQPYKHYGYVVDTDTRRIVESCSHAHGRRGGVSGAVFARRCAERLGRRLTKDANGVVCYRGRGKS